MISSSPRVFQTRVILVFGFSDGRSCLQRTVCTCRGPVLGSWALALMLTKPLPWADARQLQPRMGIWMISITALKASMSQDVELTFQLAGIRVPLLGSQGV